MTSRYYRPIVQTDRCRPNGAAFLAAGSVWFTHVERLERGQAGHVIPLGEVPREVLHNLTAARAPLCGLDLSEPRIMGVLNVTPDSFSDGGAFAGSDAAVNRAREMAREGVDIVDIGGESTRPGAALVAAKAEQQRVEPVIAALKSEGFGPVISVDTRKAGVARAALQAGASLFNDVSALSFDPESLGVAASHASAICLMHASGDPKTMQDNPVYEDVLLDVYDYLKSRVETCLAAGIARQQIVVDPGIGFGKTLEHNLALIRGLSLFHGLGCAVLLGVSRKRFIGVIGNEQDAAQRAPGSIAVALEGLRQGVQFLRVHDTRETRQAVNLWSAIVK